MSRAQSQMPIDSLKQKLIVELSQQKGNFAVAFKDLQTGKIILINERENFHAASTMKTPVLIEVYKQAIEKRFSLQDSVVIKNSFKSIVDGSSYQLNPNDDSEPSFYTRLGEKTTIDTLVYKMIIASSNLATNMLIEFTGAQNVTNTMRLLGARDIQVRRGVEDQKAYDLGLNNTTTAYDLMVIFEALAKGKAVNKKASEAMIKILFDQEFNDIIPALLPKEVKVAHKTGSIKGIHHDSGIVFLPNGKKYVLVLLSKNLENEENAKHAMATVSKYIYDWESISK
ncbi:serine hydrolase [Chitinophagaceae bacterium LWZ2-11]